MVMQRLWQFARQGAALAGLGAILAMAGPTGMVRPAAALSFDWNDHNLTIHVTEMSCHDYLDITLDKKNGENLAIWIDGWLTGEFMGGTFHKPDIRARLLHWREHCQMEPTQPLLKVLRSTRVEAGASSELVGQTADELHVKETIVILGFRCESYLELTRINKDLAEQLTRWLDGWQAGTGADPYYRPNKISEQVKGLTNGCYRNTRKALIRASAGKFR